MKKLIRKRIGRETHTFQVEGKDLWEVQMESQKLSFYDVKECGCCKSDDLYLKAYITESEGYKYIKIICRGCGASLNFGQQRQSPDTFFLTRNDDKSYKWLKYENQDYTPDNSGYANLMENNGYANIKEDIYG